MVILDRKDLLILRRLQENSRVPFRKIGSQIGLTEGAVRGRVKRLFSEGVIERFTIAVNPQPAGFRVLARLGVDVSSPGQLKAVARELAKLNEVYFVGLATGTHDLLLDVITNDIDGLKEFLVEKMGKVKGVRESDTSIVMQIYKWNGSYRYRI